MAGTMRLVAVAIAIVATGVFGVTLIKGQATAAEQDGVAPCPVVPGSTNGELPGWRVGEPMTSRIMMSTTAQDAAMSRAATLFELTGVAATRLETERAMDVGSGRVIDTTEAFDTNDKMIATLDYDLDAGRLRSFNRYGSWATTTSDRVTAAQATSLGIQALHDLGLDQPAAQAEVAWDDSMDAWLLNWPRVLEAIPVPDDALRVWIDGDGWLRAASLVETPNQPVPDSSITPSRALDCARTFMDGNPTASEAVLSTPHLEWRKPNDFIDATNPVIAATPLRLVYAVEYTISLADRQGLGVLWVDASDGSLIGGDEVQ